MNEQAMALIRRAKAYAKWYGFGIVWINGNEVSCTKNKSGRCQWRLNGKARSGFDVLAFFA